MLKKLLFIIFSSTVLIGIFFLMQRNVSPSSPTDTNKLLVTTSFYPLYYFTSEIVKDRAMVKNIVPSGTEPHDFEPTAKDMADILTSDLLVLNGGIEPWAENISSQSQNKVKIIEAGKKLMDQEITEDDQKILDPHVWLSPNLAITMANTITMALIQEDPKNKEYYEKNYAELSGRLDALDKKYKMTLSNCVSRNIVTSHSAFGYLATTYNLTQIPISGISPDREPSAQDLARIADFAKANNVTYIFFETLVSPKLSQTIAQEIGAQTLVLDPLEGISDDEIMQGKNYFTVMESNLQNLRLALQCQ